ncbi:hypothetical protein Hanom_Chr08g00723841 [Helianthus anomalus]
MVNLNPLNYYSATSRTIRSYSSPLDIMHIHKFRRKPKKYWKSLVRTETKTYWSQRLISPLRCH